MAIIKMETESVRGMTMRLRSTADDIETHLTSIKASVTSAGWQSQAREEFIMDLEMLVRMSQHSLSAMRMMSQAVDRKTDQWEAISQVFHGPFYFIENIWDSTLGFLSSSWDWLVGGMGNIHWPTLPSIVIPSVTIPGIVGGVSGIWPDWKVEHPDWWPFKSKELFDYSPKEEVVSKLSDDRKKNESSFEDMENSDDGQNTNQFTTNYKSQYAGDKPAPGMDSSYGKPGQLPLDAPINSNEGNRSTHRYKDVINQFAVGNNSRYKQDANTYCNTFAGDVAHAMGVPLPQKREFGMNSADQATIGFPQLFDYFTDPDAPVRAVDAGWQAVSSNDLSTLETHVNSGRMAVVVNNGHIAVVRPGQKITNFQNIQIAQAGATNSNNSTLNTAFGNSSPPKIFIIE